jgi:hypothetical protein
MKTKFLTKAERLQFSLSSELKSILVGLILGDLCVQKGKRSANARLLFEQGTVHENYLFHLYELFKSYSPQVPKVLIRSPDKITGTVHSRIFFNTYSLPCFNEFYELFYTSGKKVIPANIGELLTPLSLCYWVCDDGGFHKTSRVVVLSTQSFTLEDVELLCKVLNDKFNLNCTINKNGNNFVIRIPTKSLSVLQYLLSPHMPNMMRYKIGL